MKSKFSTAFLVPVIVFLLLGSVSCMGQDCKSFTKNGWRIAYNPYYKKYAVFRIDSIMSKINPQYEREWLAKDSYGEYGVYSDGWEDKHCYGCGDTSKSFFNNSCSAKEFILEYYRKQKQDKWQ